MSETFEKLPDWAKASRGPSGSLIFGDWQPVRDAIEAAYAALGRKRDGNIPSDEWNLVGLAIAFVRHATRPTCCHCDKPIEGVIIRCADCKAPMHDGYCAEAHLWPNGRDARFCLTVTEHRRQAALTQLQSERDKLLEVVRRAESALKPFCDAVYDDNGDVTIQTSSPKIDDWMTARAAYRKARDVRNEITEGK